MSIFQEARGGIFCGKGTRRSTPPGTRLPPPPRVRAREGAYTRSRAFGPVGARPYACAGRRPHARPPGFGLSARKGGREGGNRPGRPTGCTARRPDTARTAGHGPDGRARPERNARPDTVPDGARRNLPVKAARRPVRARYRPGEVSGRFGD